MVESANYLSSIEKIDRTNSVYLVTMPIGIGDVVYGLCAVDQIVKNDHEAYGRIDVLCTSKQAELFSCDPRIGNILINEREPNQRMIKKVFIPDVSERKILNKLQNKHYKAVFPGNASFLFDFKIGSPIMHPKLRSLFNDYIRLKQMQDAPISLEVRKTINNYFGNKLPDPRIDEPIDIFVPSTFFEKAHQKIARLLAFAGLNPESAKLLMVATDTTSEFTRPPTELLTAGISDIIINDPNILICILPSYSSESSQNLLQALKFHYPRVSMIDKKEGRSLFYVTALIDQANVLVTPDTYTMHLAATHKIILNCEPITYAPKNLTQTIVLYSVTNPGLYGYPNKTTVIGKGRPEQRKIQPGLYKNAMTPNPLINYFSHIKPEELKKALFSILYS